MNSCHSSEKSEGAGLFVEGAPLVCSGCGAALCLRQQVLNLTVGSTDEMLCLVCLAADNETSPEELLGRLKEYVQSRECFKREWDRYEGRAFCPAPDSCYPDSCFP